MNIRKMQQILDERPRGKRWISRFREAAQKRPVTKTGEGKTNAGAATPASFYQMNGGAGDE
jgi:hypothetical protein